VSKAKQILDQIREIGCEMVDFKIVDAGGRLHHLMIPTASMDEDSFDFGFGFDGSNFGFAKTSKSDFIARPELGESVQLDPCMDEPTATFMCNVFEAGVEVKPYASDPRAVLRKARDYMRSLGIAQESVWAPELEFHVFDGIRLRTEPHHQMYEILSTEGYWGHEDDDYLSSSRLPKKLGYHAVPPYDTNMDIRVMSVRMLTDLGFNVKYHHHEVGGPSQQEIEFNLQEMMHAADSIIWGKYIVRNVANEFGLHATFIPKPIHGEAGNGMHVHHRLVGDGNNPNVFADSTGYMGLSKMALSFLAGILTHAPALSAISNPSTNSYKRLVRGYEAPCNVCYGMANRNAALRIPAYATKPEEKRLEYRVGDATANPYLMLSAVLMAGLDGVKKGMNPEGKFGPLENMTEGWEPETAIPASLKEALDALKDDNNFLLEGGVFTGEMLEKFIADKMEDHIRLERLTHPVEFEMYDFI
jgi:glutamine synthetase